MHITQVDQGKILIKTLEFLELRIRIGLKIRFTHTNIPLIGNRTKTAY